MSAITALDIVEMPVEQRIQLVADVWDSIAELPKAVVIPEWHKQELARRLKAHQKNPQEFSLWKDVKKRILI